MLGYTREEFAKSSMCLWDFIPPESRATVNAARSETDQNGILSPKELTLTHKDNHPVHVIFGAALLSTSKTDIPGAILYLIDITEQKKLEKETDKQQSLLEKAEYYATHDSLTNLHNRNVLTFRIEQLIIQATQEKTVFTVGFIDLDNFKLINDTLGHETGDRLLQDISTRLSHTLREVDTLARVGGDEFVALINNCYTDDEIKSIEMRVLNALAPLKTTVDTTIPVSCSIGWATFPKDGTTISTLLSKADQRMYANKRTRKEDRRERPISTH